MCPKINLNINAFDKQLKGDEMKQETSYESFMRSPYRSHKISSYFEVYDELFSKFRNKKITFVEVGVLGGGSLFMWRDYFGPEARIIGVDLNPNAKKWEAYGFEIYIGSQSDELFWNNFIETVGKVDALLDDGGHSYEQQVITVEKMLDNINDGGLLVVEDTHTSYMQDFGPKKYSFMQYTKHLIDRINYRYEKLGYANPERRVWSINIYESIIAFKINNRLTKLNSHGVENLGANDGAMDHRFKDMRATLQMSWVVKRCAFLKFVPGLRRLKRVYVYIYDHLFFRAKKYFIKD